MFKKETAEIIKVWLEVILLSTTVLVVSLVLGFILWNLNKISIGDITIGNNIAKLSLLYNGVSEDSDITEKYKKEYESMATQGGAVVDSFWVYLGHSKKDNPNVLINQIFDIKSPPKPNDNINAITSVFRRYNKPRLAGTEWELSGIIGVQEPNEPVLVEEVAPIDDGSGDLFWWVRVREL